MDLSVVIINYNTYALTSACIASVYEKTEGLTYEVILVDNASTECDPERFKDAFPRIKLIKSDANLGFSGGNNLGIAHAAGECILLLNSDTELLNNALYLAWDVMRQNPAVGVLSGQLQYADGSLQHPAGHFPSLLMEAAMLLRIFPKLPSRLRRKWYLGDMWNHHMDTEADWVWGAFFMTRRHIIQALPGAKLPDHFFMYAEDMQWCHAIKQLGYTIVYHSGPKCLHHIGGSDKGIKEQGQAERLLQKKFQTIVPNEYRLLAMWHGEWYPIFLYTLRTLFYKTLKGPEKQLEAQKYWHVVQEGIKHGYRHVVQH